MKKINLFKICASIQKSIYTGVTIEAEFGLPQYDLNIVAFLNLHRTIEQIKDLRKWIDCSASIKLIENYEDRWWKSENELSGHCIVNQDYFYVTPPTTAGPSLLMNRKSFNYLIGYNSDELYATNIGINELNSLLDFWENTISAFGINLKMLNQLPQSCSQERRTKEIYRRILQMANYLPGDKKLEIENMVKSELKKLS